MPIGNFPECRICRGPSFPKFMAGEHRMYRCELCGTAFVSPVPSAEALAAFYNAYHLSDSAGGLYDKVEARMQADFPAKIELILKSSGGNAGRLLDVGCGKGFFVRACVERGIDAQGIDLSSSGVAYAVEHLKIKATLGDLREAKDQLGQFDTVTFWATIEHLPDPIATMRDIHSVLKPGGRLFLDTGIGDDWIDRLLPGVVQWYDPPQHLFVFSHRGMQHALRDAGFDMVSIDTCFERSGLRRVIRMGRGFVAALGLRGVAEIARMKQSEFGLTRFPVGNLMSIVARRPN